MLFRSRNFPQPKETSRLVFKACLSSDDVVCEIGAYRGGSTRYISKICRFVHAFEPNGDSFKQLKRNTKDLPNVKAYKLAISLHGGVRPLNVLTPGVTSSLYRIRGNSYRRTEPVKTISLDELELVPPPTCLALDCEGSEVDILKGTTKFPLEKIIVETHQPEGGIDTLDEVPRQLGAMGFHTVTEVLKFSFKDDRKSWLCATRAQPPKTSNLIPRERQPKAQTLS